jgi:hypothetical protein
MNNEEHPIGGDDQIADDDIKANRTQAFPTQAVCNRWVVISTTVKMTATALRQAAIHL